MSSSIKDSRWFLAQQFIQNWTEHEWNQFTYTEHEKLLAAAQVINDHSTQNSIDIRAQLWTNGDKNDDN